MVFPCLALVSQVSVAWPVPGMALMVWLVVFYFGNSWQELTVWGFLKDFNDVYIYSYIVTYIFMDLFFQIMVMLCDLCHSNLLEMPNWPVISQPKKKHAKKTPPRRGQSINMQMEEAWAFWKQWIWKFIWSNYSDRKHEFSAQMVVKSKENGTPYFRET